jgi:thiosulfate reductase cytochrome b subunit
MTAVERGFPGTTRPSGTRVILRHRAWLRVTHWVWVVCLTVLLMSGLQIFNAHPALYVGVASNFDDPLLSIDTNEAGTRGLTRIFDHQFDTTGVLGLSRGSAGLEARAFPSWATIPAEQDLATGRRWHFLFAWILVINGFVYLACAFASGHIRRDIWPGWRDFARVPRSVLEHLRLRFHHERRYNVLQKISYAAIIFLILPILVLAGITMSPTLDAAFPWLLVLFGGRQTARSIHFLMAELLVLFVIVHVAMVLVSGLFNNLRSMTTGRYVIDAEPGP